MGGEVQEKKSFYCFLYSFWSLHYEVVNTATLFDWSAGWCLLSHMS